MPDYPLLIAGNRDEFLARQTKRLHTWEPAFGFWPKGRQVHAGKDDQAGGTWLGVAEQAYWALVTNIRRPPFDKTYPKSRGEMPLMWLSGEYTLEWFAKEMERTKHLYAPFNLIFGQGSQAHFLSSDHSLRATLPKGIYGISNASLDTPWPKVYEGKKRLRAVLENEPNEEALLNLLSDTRTYNENLPTTGLPVEKEVMLSAICIKSPDYGTRASSIIEVDSHDRLTLSEWDRPKLDKLSVKIS